MTIILRRIVYYALFGPCLLLDLLAFPFSDRIFYFSARLQSWAGLD